MSENLSQKEMLAAKFEGGDEAREQTPIASTNKQEFTDPMLEALAEADELEHEQIKVAKDAQTSKWPKGESPGDRTKDFVEKHGGKIGRRSPRHSGKGYEGRDPNYKYWVPIRERVENKVTQKKIEDALAEPLSKENTDLSVAKKGNPPPDWQALREMNQEIDKEQKRKQEVQARTGGEKQQPLSRDTKQLRKEAVRVRREKYFGRDRFN